MIRAFAQTENVPLAAALAVCGIPVVTEPMVDERSGRVRSVMRLGDVSVDGGRFHTRQLLQDLRAGTLEARDPQHPAMAALWAIHNLAMLRRLILGGEKCGLISVPKAARSFYDDEPADALANPGGRALMETGSISMAASLGVIGVPVCGVSDDGARLRMWAEGFPLIGPQLRAETADAVALVGRYRAGTLATEEPWHPLVIGLQAIAAAAKLETLLGSGEKLVALRPPGTTRQAIVREQASDRTMDRTARFLRI